MDFEYLEGATLNYDFQDFELNIMKAIYDF